MQSVNKCHRHIWRYVIYTFGQVLLYLADVRVFAVEDVFCKPFPESRYEARLIIGSYTLELRGIGVNRPNVLACYLCSFNQHNGGTAQGRTNFYNITRRAA